MVTKGRVSDGRWLRGASGCAAWWAPAVSFGVVKFGDRNSDGKPVHAGLVVRAPWTASRAVCPEELASCRISALLMQRASPHSSVRGESDRSHE